MSNTDKKLSEIFDIDPIHPGGDLEVASAGALSVHTDDEEKKKKYVKDTMVQMIEKGKAALEQLHLVARDSEKSRDFEVLFGGMKTITEIGEKLLEVDSKKKEEQQSDSKNVNNTQNNIFVGSTAELQQFLKNNPINTQ